MVSVVRTALAVALVPRAAFPQQAAARLADTQLAALFGVEMLAVRAVDLISEAAVPQGPALAESRLTV